MIKNLLIMTMCATVAAAGAAPPVARKAYPATPLEVVRAFCEAERTSGEWNDLVAYTTWIDGGSDERVIGVSYTILAGSQTRSRTGGDSTATLRVAYEYAGDFGDCSGEGICVPRYAPSRDTVEFRLVKRSGAWKIEAPLFERNYIPLERILQAKDYCGYAGGDSEYAEKCRAVVKALRTLATQKRL